MHALNSDIEGERLGSAQAQRSPEQVREHLFRHGSFRGTVAAGAWPEHEGGVLRPDVRLRWRFEYYLLALGEVSVSELRSWVADEATRDLGRDAAQPVMALWDRYWQLRTHDFEAVLDAHDRSTWDRAFAEQQAVRRQILGAEWAQAFFAGEHAALMQFVAQIDGTLAVPVDPDGPVAQGEPGCSEAERWQIRSALYGEPAAQRLQQADAQWAAWEQRLEQAQQHSLRIRMDLQLTLEQREHALDRYLHRHFESVDERRRVRALLNLPH